MQEEQRTALEPNIEGDKKGAKGFKKVIIYEIASVLLVFALFGSGWLLGTGRFSLRSDPITSLSSSSNNSSAPTDGVDELYQKLKQNYDGDIQDPAVLDELKAGLVKAAGDPYTVYLSKQDTKDFNESLNGTFEGIGAELGKKDNFIIIVAPIKGTPAFKAGLQPQDIVVEIDGESSTDISISDAVKRIRGPKGETVTLTVIREGAKVEVPIVRDTINIPSVEWKKEGEIGIITISRFGDDTAVLTKKAATELQTQGIKGVVLDLRGDPGGLLDAAVKVASVWLPRGSKVLDEKRGGEIVQSFTTQDAPILEGLPTVVLINEGSASASEIVSGALRDNNAATLMGEQSFGKGSVQRLMDLDGGGSLKVTIARWYTPGGKNIDKEGIAPDIEVMLTTEDRKAARDPQMDAAIAEVSK